MNRLSTKTWLEAAQADCRGQYEDEQFSEHCEANSYEFYEDGSIGLNSQPGKTRKRMHTMEANTIQLPESTLTKHQKKVYGPRFYTEGGQLYKITATVRHDDECGNGHNSFSVTADIDEKRGNKFCEYGGGCCHEEISKHFPELAPFIKWHLCGPDM